MAKNTNDAVAPIVRLSDSALSRLKTAANVAASTDRQLSISVDTDANGIPLLMVKIGESVWEIVN